MRRLLLLTALLPISFAVFAATSPAHAGDSVPTQCEVPLPPNAASVSQETTIPPCEAIAGLCISFHFPSGPSPAVHPQGGGATIPPDGDCSAFPPACVVDVFPNNPPGPSRSVHAGRALPAGFNPGDIFNIPPECLEIPSTGFDIAPVLMAGLGALGAGMAITGLRRRLA